MLVIVLYTNLSNLSPKEDFANQVEMEVINSDAKLVLKQIASSLNYIHSKDIAHRDLKLENILYLKDGKVKVIDFGFAIRSRDKQRTFCGTPTYMAPEIIRRSPYNGLSVDVWAFGIMAYRMVTGTYPFMAQIDKELYKKITAGNFDSSLIVNDQLRDLISRMLRVASDERIKASEVSRL